MNPRPRVARLAATLLSAGSFSGKDVDDGDFNVDGTPGSDCLRESSELGDVWGNRAD